MRELLLFHWSPSDRRKQILRYGLRPRCRPTTNPVDDIGNPVGNGDIRGWRAPYICLGPSPSYAWALSGAQEPGITEWDLWQVWRSHLGRHRLVREDGHIKEVRAFDRIYKRHVWYVATRSAP